MKLLIKLHLVNWICLNFAKIPIFKCRFYNRTLLRACSSISKEPIEDCGYYILNLIILLKMEKQKMLFV